ncbi:GTP-binding protein yptV2 [Trichinella spiralis]|uniref:GTP-binding protein yptV2 n=1 Tax=Trichinella spiralis TaxID=6334 RepID=UPI0001EFEF21|nr:GTP-binding protein yptV2 [Trichinella spiralis]
MLVGDSYVGKTCLLVRLKDDKFLGDNFQSTVGIDYTSKVISVNGSSVKLQVWDTAGQERFHSLTRAYYRDTDAVLLLFDLTNYDSFIRCRSWLADVKENSLECAFICLVGSKLDLQGKRVVKFEEAIKMAQVYYSFSKFQVNSQICWIYLIFRLRISICHTLKLAAKLVKMSTPCSI